MHENAHNLPEVLSAIHTALDNGDIPKAELDAYVRSRRANLAAKRGVSESQINLGTREHLRMEFACDMAGAYASEAFAGKGVWSEYGISSDTAPLIMRAIDNALSRGSISETDAETVNRQYRTMLDAGEALSAQSARYSENAAGASNIYDYSKSFGEQVDDWLAGKIPRVDTLLIGGTPHLYQQIGLSALPMTIDQTHIDYMVNGTKNADHHLGVGLIKQLPTPLQNPVAIIESATRPDDSVMAIVKGEVNGKQLVAAIRIGGNGVQNGAIIDSNHIVSTQGRQNAVTKLLADAIAKEASGIAGIYYWNKEEALPLTVHAGVQFPSRHINDGLLYSIFDAASPVNRKYMDQTQTQQFQRWFDESKVVSKDGTPKVVYRSADGQFTGLKNGDALYLS